MKNQNRVRQNFGRNALNYRYSLVHNDPIDLDRMIRILDPKPEDNALDVATGAGHTAIKLGEYIHGVVAIDITPEMLSEAQKQAVQNKICNIEFRIEDVHNIKIPDNTFDIVVSRLAAHHFSNIKKALSEMCRVLKPGGKLYILDCSVVDGDESEKIFNNIEFLRDNSHIFSYSPRLWKKLLSELPITIRKSNFYRLKYQLPQWFDRMNVDEEKRNEIFEVLNGLSKETKKYYPYDKDYITTYRMEILVEKEHDKKQNSI